MSFFLINDIRLNLPMGWVPFQLLYLGPFSNVRCKPLYEVATSHTARKTFVGNLYKQVPDPNLIASMSGHVEGSRAFNRYRTIDDEMKRKLVDMIN